MSDLLSAVSEALSTPEALLKRSSEARAAVNGTTAEEVLSAWSGGAPAPAKAAPQPQPSAEPKETPAAAEPAAATAATPAPTLTIEVPAIAVAPQPEPEPEVELEPIALRTRVRTAARVGGWTGAALGLIGFLVASTQWATNTTVIGEGPYTPVIQASSNAVIIGIALVSLVFGMVVAALSRAAAAWVSPGMRLSNSPASSAWLGLFLGLILGVVAGALLTSSFGTPVEGVEGVVQMPVLATLAVMILGGAALGAITASATQAVGVPVAVAESPEEIAEIRGRLGGALRFPLTALLILLLLVLPFAFALIQSAELTEGGAVVLAIVTASGILTFAALAGNRPNVRLSFGEVMVAVIGILTVIVVIFAVLLARSEPEIEANGPGGTVQILAKEDLSFEPPEWSVPEGNITIEYTDEGDIIHTLTIEGHENLLDLRVETAGAVDHGEFTLGPGTYTLFCTIPGHREAGMQGTLTVEAAG